MKKEYDKAIRLAFNAVALTLIILGIIQAYAPYFGGPDPREAEIREAMTHVVALRPADLPPLLHDPGGRPVMLVLYASWCGPCMLEMPRIVELMHEGKLDQIKPLFVSMDYDLRAFTIYLVHHDYHTLFTPYILNGDSKDLQDTLELSGSGYNRHIPYIGFFDKSGRLATEFFGVSNEQELMDAVSFVSGRH